MRLKRAVLCLAVLAAVSAGALTGPVNEFFDPSLVITPAPNGASSLNYKVWFEPEMPDFEDGDRIKIEHILQYAYYDEFGATKWDHSENSSGTYIVNTAQGAILNGKANVITPGPLAPEGIIQLARIHWENAAGEWVHLTSYDAAWEYAPGGGGCP